MRMAWVGPVSPCKVGQAHHSELLLPEMAREASIDLFVEDYTPANPIIRQHFACFPCSQLPARHQQAPYDVVLYQIGNNTQHRAALHLLPQVPGILDLHEVRLDALFTPESPHAIGSLLELLAYAQGVISHSRFQYEYLLPVSSGPVACLPLPKPIIGVPDERQRAGLRDRLGIPRDAFVVASFGFVHPFKRPDVALAAFGHLAQKAPEALYLHVGVLPQTLDDYWNRLVTSVVGSPERVRATGWVSDEEMADYAAAVDVCFNLRYPSVGEVSAVALLCMGAGRPVLITPIDSFEEFPEDACVRIPRGPHEVQTATAALMALWEDPVHRRTLGRTAHAHIAAHHEPNAVASGYLQVLRRWLTSASHAAESHAPAVHTPTPPTPAQEQPPAPAQAEPPLHPMSTQAITAQPAEHLALPLRLADGHLLQAIQESAQHGARYYAAVQAHTSGGDRVHLTQTRTMLPAAVHTGHSRDLVARLTAPASPGEYQLAVTLESELAGQVEHLPGCLHLPLHVSPDSRNPGLLRAALHYSGRALTCLPGASLALPLRLQNLGDTCWRHAPPTSHGQVNLGVHLYAQDGRLLTWDYLRASLPYDVIPGEQVAMACILTAPEAHGEYRLELDLVAEGVAWFADRGSSPVNIPLTVIR